MTARLPLKRGSSDQRGDDVTHWWDWAFKYARSYNFLLGRRDGYYGSDEAAFTREMQRRVGLPQTGVFDETLAARVHYAGRTETHEHRPIWFYSAPGSGADWWVGPSFEVGKRVQDVLHINHQPIGFPKGGYLGLMGGDPTFSYNEVIAAEKAELRRLIATCPDLNDPNVEFWFSGYSQSADGMAVAVNELFGDGGEFRHLRDRINGLILFGNPATQGTGIARRVLPKWLNDKTFNINASNDFYAVAPDEIRPAMYGIIVEAEMELPFFVHLLRVAVPIILQTVPIFGGLLGPLAVPLVAGMTGLNAFTPLLGGLMGQAAGGTGSAGDAEVDRKLIELFSVTGIIRNLPALIQLIAALPGLQRHGEYHLPMPEFGGRTGIDAGYDFVAAFRR